MGTIVLYGGTFNPIHKGHVNAVKAVAKELSPDRVIIMPAKIPPHKAVVDLASEKDRVEMCRLAFLGIQNVEISDYELKRNEKSYSFYTVEHLKEKFPNDKIFFIVGSDMLMTFNKWYRYKEILSMSSIVCVSREENDFNELEAKANGLREFGEIIVLKTKPFKISSTQIRDMIKNNKDTSCYIDEIVVKYIKEKNIY
ncbi:MAG: nicotinate (nicotinamide) nucleotide adenylyltransferase [Clostridiales bacterium]|nr:nicotinate (nicotinamide) nucleotide adenylyltransferase [Clostridiales bacterium]